MRFVKYERKKQAVKNSFDPQTMTEQFSFAKRTDWDLRANPLIAALKEKKARGQTIYDLTESNPTHCGFAYPKEKILNALAQPKNLNYEPSP